MQHESSVTRVYPFQASDPFAEEVIDYRTNLRVLRFILAELHEASHYRKIGGADLENQAPVTLFLA